MRRQRPDNVPLAQAGSPIERARCALIILHGKGGAQQKMLTVAGRAVPSDVTIFAPAASGRVWWPQAFRVPVATTDPNLRNALRTLDALVEEVIEAGFPPSRIVIAGFSQGACLALEHAARGTRRYRAIVAMSGALLGTVRPAAASSPGAQQQRYTASLEGQRIAISCHSRDPHIPLENVEASARILRAMGADVSTYVEPGTGHGMLRHDMEVLRTVLGALPGEAAITATGDPVAAPDVAEQAEQPLPPRRERPARKLRKRRRQPPAAAAPASTVEQPVPTPRQIRRAGKRNQKAATSDTVTGRGLRAAKRRIKRLRLFFG